MQQQGKKHSYITKGKIKIIRRQTKTPYKNAVETYVKKIDDCRGAVFSSNYEYPGRYTRWDTAIINPPLAIEARDKTIYLKAFNARGKQLLKIIMPRLEKNEHVKNLKYDGANQAVLKIIESKEFYSEELRSRRPNVFSILREIIDMFYSEKDDNLALYGAFGYDLVFQFEKHKKHIAREKKQRDLVLYLPDEILVVDHHAVCAWKIEYDFEKGKHSTAKTKREIIKTPYKAANKKNSENIIMRDLQKGEYARLVKRAKEKFKKGDLFEVVLTQVFREMANAKPSEISSHLRALNPSPYSFFLNLGEQEYLVGASPEMFIRVKGRRVETCPISGTIKRGKDPIEDSQQILKLLNSKKDEAELTMCSDVDRNDKSRVCEAGSVKVIARRQIELYSRLIHTVDHIEGRLRENMDAFDAFLSHAWAVTVTGAPKLWAIRFIEENEKEPRHWYGGAIGMVGCNGDMNTGLTLRTIRIKNGIAEVRAGATLLYDSIPNEEEAETELKASAMLDAIGGENNGKDILNVENKKCGKNKKIMLIDYEDSFVHTLANYFRQTGGEVLTVRAPVSEKLLKDYNPNLVVLSPGPGCPADFNCRATINMVLKNNFALFGVCLGHQAIAESFKAKLKTLPKPFHGKPSRLKIIGKSRIFAKINTMVTVGRYHSLYVDEKSLPKDFTITSKSVEGTIMSIEHKTRPIAGIQFHPESIMSLGQNVGQAIINNIVEKFTNFTNYEEI